MDNRKNIVIVGGGITGLSAAYYLQKEIKEEKLPYHVKLVEASDRLGGKISTLRKDGFTIERGPDSFLSRKKPAVKLAEEVGLKDKLVRNATGQSYILVNNKLRKMPRGSHMGIPTKARPFLLSNLFSLKGKMRAGLDFMLPRGKNVQDQSLGGFLRHRFGNEVVENVMDPLLSGIYSGDIDEMSLMATYPNFYQLQQEHKSLIKGLRKTLPKAQSPKKRKAGAFYAFRDGFESLVEQLALKLDEGTVTLNAAVDHIEKKDHGYHLLLSSGEVYKADAVIMATSHESLPKVFSQYDYFREFDNVPSTSVANVAMAFDQSAIKRDINGTGFVVSRNSDFRITACTWTHKKWPHSTPGGNVLLRCYVGRPNDQEVVHLSDEEIKEIVLKDLNKTMNITQEPKFSVITRWENARPQYTVGHTERIVNVRSKMAEDLPGVYLAGASFEGVGVPDCIEQGEKAVGNVLKFLG
ncbi:protoporphyrinogen oxidase [Virgibacillus phasianinus]|uniref:Coproporphyrinogen III oxidase n=1 Tax=Virgibacillus phasianinus TaxID=2017483 RepID=A0A220TYB7_9BACI|nr:protoporphyrinogen oxidase [Virgibacillus phasianinus]ASK60848.1 protoporphyrinogen oxidase [Virgibacillus phasianinus]